MEKLISADAGTSGAKVSLVDRTGRILVSSIQSYPVHVEGLRVEQDPRDWWEALKKGLAVILKEYPALDGVEALVLSGQMQDLIPVSSKGEAGRAILYSDTRARKQWDVLSLRPGREYLEETTANLGDPSGLSSKFLWLGENSPELLDGEGKILLGAHDYLCWRLTGRFVTDYTNASTTGLLNFKENTWDEQILNRAGITSERLPLLEPAATVTGTLTRRAAEELGLPPGLRVIHGSGDAGASTLGDGAGVPGVISCYLGTSGWAASSGTGIVPPSTGIYNLRHPDPRLVIHIGPMSLTGGNADWAVRNLIRLPLAEEEELTADEFALFTRLASRAKPGAGGLFYLPYLMGERSPFRDPDARGAFIGLGKETGRPEMCRAVLEGVAYALVSILEVMDDGNPRKGILKLSGGGAGNPLWREILAGVSGNPVFTASSARESGVLGNVIIAGNALGWFDSWELPRGFPAGESAGEAEPGVTDFYREGLAIFKTAYPALKKVFLDTRKWLEK